MAQVSSKGDLGSATESSQEDVVQAKESVQAFISALPRREGWTEPLVLYKNYWFRPIKVERILLVKHGAFKPRSDDIILATHPKCGTTWLKALAFTINNRSLYNFFFLMVTGGGKIPT
jgi:estrone sulfotransferase